jgi:diguanylate cyclase (GGDEF)-like protein
MCPHPDDRPRTGNHLQHRGGAARATPQRAGGGETYPQSVADQVPGYPMSKHALVLTSHAMERAFAGGADDLAGLVIGLFQRRAYFNVESVRSGEPAAAGHTVVVGFCGDTTGVPEGVHAVSLRSQDPRASQWTLMLLRAGLAIALVGLDRQSPPAGECALEGSRTFDTRWTFDRRAAVAQTSALLDELADRLAPRVVEAARGGIAATESVLVTGVEASLAGAADHLVRALVAAGRRNSDLQVDLAAAAHRAELAEVDQLTGLSNRHYLERFLGDQDAPADLLAMLVDVDDLKAVNDTWGHAAGDAVLAAVATTVRRHSGPGDVVVRWGGDEFLVLVADPSRANPAALLTMGERLATAVAGEHPAAPWEHLNLSVSVGVSQAVRTRLPLSELDAALYKVKCASKGHAGLAPDATP